MVFKKSQFYSISFGSGISTALAMARVEKDDKLKKLGYFPYPSLYTA
jgi:hypothetical protein